MRRLQQQAGFTLIETLIVLMLSGILLTSATALLVNFTLLRAQPVETVEFIPHVKSLGRFLNTALSGEALPLAYRTNLPEGSDESPVKLDRFPDQSPNRPPQLEFILPGNHPLVRTREHYNRFVRCQLVHLEHSLYLYWYLEPNDEFQSDDLYFHRQLSPWVTSLRYAYYDADNNEWETELELISDPTQPGNYQMPDCLLIDFQEKSSDEPRTLPIYLPQAEVVIDGI